MLNLNYIILDGLPEIEMNYLKENLRLELTAKPEFTKRKTADEPVLCQLTALGKQHIPLSDFPAEECLCISPENKTMQEAVSLGMATLGYLGDEIEGNETEAVENVCADMYAEGMEEVDFTFLQHVYERHHQIPWTILETKRCIVREFSMDYLDALFELYAGEGMTDYLEPLYSYEEEKQYQQAYMEHMYRFYGYGMWIVCEKKTGKLLGRAGVEHREELGGELELGYAIGTPYQRQGYATEVCEAILSYVKEELEITELSCLIEPENEVSVHFAEKLGFSYREEMEISGKSMKKYVLKLSDEK